MYSKCAQNKSDISRTRQAGTVVLIGRVGLDLESVRQPQSSGLTTAQQPSADYTHFSTWGAHPGDRPVRHPVCRFLVGSGTFDSSSGVGVWGDFVIYYPRLSGSSRTNYDHYHTSRRSGSDAMQWVGAGYIREADGTIEPYYVRYSR